MLAGWQDRYVFNMEKLTWPTAAVVIAAFATILGLVWLDQDLTAAIVGMGSLLGLKVHQDATNNATQRESMTEVKTQVNGNNAKLVEALLKRGEEDRELLAKALIALTPGTQLTQSAPEQVQSSDRNS